MSKSDQVRVLVILASVRPVRAGDQVLRWWLDATSPVLSSVGARVDVADLRDVRLPMDDEPDAPHQGVYAQEHTRAWSARVAAADAFLVITSEHNHAIPASLKNAFDHLASEWGGKPVAWVGYGNTSSGTRALVSGKQVTTTLGMPSVGSDVLVRLLDWPDGVMVQDPARDEIAVGSLVELVRVARALRPLRVVPVPVHGLPADLVASRAGVGDVDELVALQRCCWVDEAIANDMWTLAPLREGPGAVEDAVRERSVLVVRRGARLVASVQSWPVGDDLWIGRLMVAPDQRGRGVASALLRHVESAAPAGTRRLRLSTGERSEANLALYARQGFVRADGQDGVVRLVKRREARSAVG